MSENKKSTGASIGFKFWICLTLLFSLSVSGLSIQPLSVQAEGTIIYINSSATGSGDGSSWKDAFVDLQSALSISSEGDEIWIAEGTYYPSQDIEGNSAPEDPRTKTFQMKNELTILGGFPAGNTSATMEDRDALEHQTILSGDLNKNSAKDDEDSYHVFYHPQGTFLNPTAVLDGVTITGGNANSYAAVDGSDGGGMFNNRSHPKLIDVTIENNFAQSSGGGILNQSSNIVYEGGAIKGNNSGFGAGIYIVDSNPIISNLTIENNIAWNSGGGVYTRGGKPNLENVLIKNNEAANMGGGITSINSGIVLHTVKVIGNKASEGAGIANNGSGFTMNGGEVSSNIAGGESTGSGGGMYLYSWDAKIEDVNISNNTANAGGGVYIEHGSSLFTDVKINNNRAKYGAGVSVMAGNPKYLNSELNENKASENGGAFFLNASSIELQNTNIGANIAKNGGGIYSTEGTIKLSDGEIKGNQAANNGAGIYNYNSVMYLTNSLISGNAALSGGGIYSNYVDDSKLLNVTITGNKASKGGGIYNSASNPVIQNSIIWGNSSSIHNSGSLPSVAYSLIQGSGGSSAWTSSFGKDLGSNIDVDPGFIEGKEHEEAPTSAGNYRLSAESAAFDKGSNELLPVEVVKDLDNNYRKMGNQVDLGAYEIVIADTESPTWPSNSWLNAYPETSKSVNLNWPIAKDNYKIAGYKIFVDGKMVHDFKQEDLSGYYRPEYVVSGLQLDTAYTFSVVAYDEAGNTSKEISRQASTIREPDEEPPVWEENAELTFVEEVDNGIEVAWPSANDNQGINRYIISVDGLEVGYSDNERFIWNLYDLKPNTGYEISVTAIDYEGNVSETLNQTYTTLPVWQEGAELVIEETDEFSPKLTVPASDSALVRWYEVVINGEVNQSIYLPDTTTYLHSLLPNTEYEITVNAINYSGEKLAMLNKLFKTSPIWNEDPKLEFSEISQSSFFVTWPKIESSLPMDLELLVDGQRWNYFSKEQQADYIFNLEPDTEYEVALKVISYDGTVIQELKDKVTTAPYSDQEPPYWYYENELKVTEIKETSMKLIWPKATDNESIKGYRILVDNQEIAAVNADTTEYSITGLTKGTTYTLIVQAYDEKGNTSFIRIGVQTASATNSGGGSGGGQVIVLPPSPPANPAPAPTVPPQTEVPKDSTTPSVKVTDIKGHWAEKQILEAISKKVVGGYLDETFRPDKPINRAEFTILLSNALGLEGEGAELQFSDNKYIGESARTAIKRAVKAGVVHGFDDNSFRPAQNITRMEMAAMIARAMELEGDSEAPTGFADDSSIPKWARGSIGVMKETGIISGRKNNKFEPAVNATRAETVVMLLRMIESKEK